MQASSAGPLVGAAGSATPTPASTTKSIRRKELLLYDKCIERDGVGQHYDTDEMLKIAQDNNLFHDLEGLMISSDWLVGYKAFQLLRGHDGEAYWKTRDMGIATMLRNFSQNERMVYQQIEVADTDGIWLRQIHYKTNLHLNVVNKIVKELKKKHLVKEFTGSRQAGVSKKMLILQHLEPSADNLGGAFYPDGELDSGFVEAMSYTIFRFVEKRSWAEQPGSTAYKKRKRDEDAPAPTTHGVSVIDHAAKKRKQADGDAHATDFTTFGTIATKTAPPEEPKYKPFNDVDTRKPLIPLPPTYKNYPTTTDVRDHVTSLGAFSRAMLLKLKDSDFETVLDMLCFDGRMERIDDPHSGGPNEEGGGAEPRWRTLKRSHEMWSSKMDFSWVQMVEQTEDKKGGVGNGYSEVPCGRCPVFDLCAPGGPVNPESCRYFDDWLNVF